MGASNGALAGLLRILTVEANREVIRYQARQGVLIERRQRMAWLDHQVPECDILVTPPAHGFVIEEILARPVQTSFAL